MVLFGSECVTILSGTAGTPEPGAEIPGTKKRKKQSDFFELAQLLHEK